MKERIAIVGAGVSGLTCGVVFAERGWRVEIFAETIGQETTSGAAAAIWFPYDVEPLEKVIGWSLSSYEKFHQLTHEPESGVTLLELRHFVPAGDIAVPGWAQTLGARRLGATEIPTCFTSGFALPVPLADTTRYLDYLREGLLMLGGTVTQIALQNLNEIPDRFGAILNCAGIGARELARDPELEPHRGQVVIVPKMELNYAVACDEALLMYAIPRANDCVFGGTNALSHDLRPNAAESTAILAQCSQVLGVAPPRILRQRVGLRPFRRSGVRLEAEQLCDGRTVLHNYGHGGAGFTISWGCAQEVFAQAQSSRPRATSTRLPETS